MINIKEKTLVIPLIVSKIYIKFIEPILLTFLNNKTILKLTIHYPYKRKILITNQKSVLHIKLIKYKIRISFIINPEKEQFIAVSIKAQYIKN